MSLTIKPRLTAEEYLAIERQAAFKSEFCHGEMLAMAGASKEHNRITLDTATHLNIQLRDGSCEAFAGDMRVRVSPTELYAYPDVVVVCGEPEFEDDQGDVLLNPTLIIEVLSPSTEAHDRGDKFAQYQQLESLREYVLISQDRYRVEQYVRQEGDRWLLSITCDPIGAMHLPSIGCDLQLQEVYRRVRLEPRTPDRRAEGTSGESGAEGERECR